MFPTMHKTLALTLTAMLFAGAIRAQTLDGEVVRNPDDTVTYTLDVNGPPRGFAQIFVSTGFAPNPWSIHPFGPIYLDPNILLPLTPLLPLDLNGHCNFQIQVPTYVTLDQAFAFQTVNIDAAMNIALGKNAIALGQNVVPAPVIPFGYTFAYDTGGSQLRMAGRGQPGTVVEVKIINSEGVRVTEKTTIGADGKFTLNVTAEGGISEDDDVMVIHDGSMVDKVDLYKF